MATAVASRIFKNFINGEWVESRSGKAYENRNPANTDELIGMFVSSTGRTWKPPWTRRKRRTRHGG